MHQEAPPQLGRGVIVLAGQTVPDNWASCERVLIDESVVRSPTPVVNQLHSAWISRTPIVLELGVDPANFRDPRSYAVEPWQVGARFEPMLDRLHFLLWSNNVDARNGTPIWWWGRKAERLGATSCDGCHGDVVLPDGRLVWIDGGPRGPLDASVGLIVHSESVDLGRLMVVPYSESSPDLPLAPDQLAAVHHGSGPARVIAPAGSGKTRVLTERLRLLHCKRGYERNTTLAVAYNVKARAEMEQRCADFAPRVQTLNAFGQSVLNQALGRLNVIDEREQRRIVEGLVEIPVSRRRANTDPLAPYLEALSLARLALRDPNDVENERDDIPGFASMFDRYRDFLRDRGVLDFDEQIYRAIEVMLADGGLRQEVQRRCKHMLVDEFQDLTPAHVLLLRLACLTTLDCFGVGDDDQVIYGHAGADPQFLLDFAELFPGATQYALQINYRCAVPIVSAARTLLGYNKRRIVKTILPGADNPRDTEALQVVRVPTESISSRLVAQVEQWIADGGAPSDIAVLARVNSQLLAPQVALSQQGVPVTSALDERVLERTGLRAALAYLRIAVSDVASAADITEILRRPSRSLPQWFPDRLRRRKLWSMNDLRSIGTTMSDKEADKLEKLIADLETVRRVARKGSTAEVLRAVRDEVGLDSAMELLDKSAGGEGSSHLDDLDALLQVSALEPDPVKFEPWLRSWLARSPTVDGHSGGEQDIAPRVTLATIHKVKGLEWEQVVLFAVNSGVFPHRLSADEEEERRVLHVGLTRGRAHVVIVSDELRPSFMLEELDGTAVPRVSRSPVATRLPAPSANKTATSLAPEDEKLFEALRVWRTGRAKADKVPPYIVLSDQTLRAVCTKKPTSLVQLTRVPGIGPTKLENYGDELLEVLARFV